MIYSIPRLEFYWNRNSGMSSHRAAKPDLGFRRGWGVGWGFSALSASVPTLFCCSPFWVNLRLQQPRSLTVPASPSAIAHSYPREDWARRPAPPRSPFLGLGALNLAGLPAHIQSWSTPTGPHATGYHFAHSYGDFLGFCLL